MDGFNICHLSWAAKGPDVFPFFRQGDCRSVRLARGAGGHAGRRAV